MENVLNTIIPEDEKKEIKEFVSTLLLLSKEDRAILLSNAYALKARVNIETLKKSKYQES